LANEEHHRVGTVVGTFRVLVVDHYADAPPVLDRAQGRVLLEELSWAGLELDDRAAGVEKLGPEIIADELLVVVGARTVVVSAHLRQGRRVLASGGEHRGGAEDRDYPPGALHERSFR